MKVTKISNAERKVLEIILNTVCEKCKISVNEFMENVKNRERQYLIPRCIFAKICTEYEIAASHVAGFISSDHATILNNVIKFDGYTNPKFGGYGKYEAAYEASKQEIINVLKLTPTPQERIDALEKEVKQLKTKIDAMKVTIGNLERHLTYAEL